MTEEYTKKEWDDYKSAVGKHFNEQMKLQDEMIQQLLDVGIKMTNARTIAFTLFHRFISSGVADVKHRFLYRRALK